MKSFLIVFAVLGGFTALAGGYGIYVWDSIGPTDMGATGWSALVLMIVLTLGIGVGLMGLVFYSARKGYDDQQQDQHRRDKR